MIDRMPVTCRLSVSDTSAIYRPVLPPQLTPSYICNAILICNRSSQSYDPINLVGVAPGWAAWVQFPEKTAIFLSPQCVSLLCPHSLISREQWVLF
jgi:hypothetical protein